MGPYKLGKGSAFQGPQPADPVKKEALEPLLKVPELSIWLQVKESTIRKKVCYGNIPCVHIGRSVRFRRQDIEEWLNTQNGASGGPK